MFHDTRKLLVFLTIFTQCNASSSADDRETLYNLTRFDGVALILARGGSKGIPRKNLVTISGISLLGRAIKTINESGAFSEIWVSTDSAEIAKEADKYGAKVHKRLENLAQDTTPSIEAVQDFIQGHPNVNSVALFQCTSVFLRTKYIHEACRTFQNADCVFASTRFILGILSYDGFLIPKVNILNQLISIHWIDPDVRTGMENWWKLECSI
ncbi:N-acylneuraminate cytidylyltransferase A isoform X2 [Hermetia illucens]|uniref:N-acylneuraminate cytidylyltransferase A isoform X2 n=1 Tax=Hermetia illucens TaxID=343691 RepID=UPI0018CC5BAF|nr:N-acylneuraminate cytidylyltransferase A isoform X2 [Hermetia illucens]